MQTLDGIKRVSLFQGFGLIKILKVLFLTSTATAASLLLGCGGTSSSQRSTPTAVPDLYVAGIESNGSFDVVKYWKNGVAVALTDGTKNGLATSLVVSENDV